MAEFHIDCLGDMCPVPNLRVRRKLKELGVGDVIVMITDHSCAGVTICGEMRRKGHRAALSEIDNGIWQVVVERVK